MSHRSPARFLAPIALVAVTIALIMVLTSSGLGGDDDSEDSRAGSGRTATTATAERRQRRTQQRTYVVKQGDTLEAIAERTGVPLQQLLERNPDLDPQALIPGQRVRLRAS